MKKRVFIVGGTSCIGESLIRSKEGQESYEISFSHRNIQSRPQASSLFFDVLSSTVSYELAKSIKSAQAIIYLAESRKGENEETLKSHMISISKIFDLMQPDTQFIYLSSSRVFDGSKCGFTLTDTPVPIDEYGNWKLKMEIFLNSSSKNVLIVRLGKIITRKDHLFWNLANIQRTKSLIRANKNKCVGAISLKQVCNMLIIAIEGGIEGLLQFSPNPSIAYSDLIFNYLKLTIKNPKEHISIDTSTPLHLHDCLLHSPEFGRKREDFEGIWQGINSLRL